jgi:hypothetical protein
VTKALINEKTDPAVSFYPVAPIQVTAVMRPEKIRKLPIHGPKRPRKHSPGFTLGYAKK